MIKFLTFLCSLLILSSTLANPTEEVKLENFAFGYKLDFEDGESVYTSSLPQEVYKNATKSNLGDLRVFNSNMEVVPHKIAAASAKYSSAVIKSPQSLKLFNLYSEVGKEKSFEKLKVKTSSSGTLIEVTGPQGKNLKKDKVLSGYLMDTSDLDTPIDKLIFDFDNPSNEQFLTKVNVYASNNLEDWRTVASNVVLANLVNQNENLVKNVIDMPRLNYKYYRVLWFDSSKPLKVAKIVAHFGKKYEREKPKLNWMTIQGKVDPEYDSFINYNIKGYFPISKIKVKFPQPNSIARITLEARNSEEETWKLRGGKKIYNFIKHKVTIEDNVLSFSPQRFKFWRIIFQTDRSAFGSKIPDIQIGWSDEELKFLARGTAPFYVGYGNALIDAPKTMSILDSQFADTKAKATVSEHKKIAGKEKLTYIPPKPKKIYPWKKWILWAVLVLGVFGLVRMALSLMKTMQEEAEQNKSTEEKSED